MNTAMSNRKSKRMNLMVAGAVLLALAGLWWAAAVSQSAGVPAPGEQEEARRIIVYSTTSAI